MNLKESKERYMERVVGEERAGRNHLIILYSQK